MCSQEGWAYPQLLVFFRKLHGERVGSTQMCWFSCEKAHRAYQNSYKAYQNIHRAYQHHRKHTRGPTKMSHRAYRNTMSPKSLQWLVGPRRVCNGWWVPEEFARVCGSPKSFAQQSLASTMCVRQLKQQPSLKYVSQVTLWQFKFRSALFKYAYGNAWRIRNCNAQLRDMFKT